MQADISSGTIKTSMPDAIAEVLPRHRPFFGFISSVDTGKNGKIPVPGLWIWNAESEVRFNDVRVTEPGPADVKQAAVAAGEAF